MIKKPDKNVIRKKRHNRMRFTLTGAAQKPRLNVFRSLSHIYAQLIDDTANQGQGHTILSVSTVEKEVAEKVKGLEKVDAAKVVGEIVAKRAKEKGIEEVVFDRGGYRYTGRIAAVAEGARKGGLKV